MESIERLAANVDWIGTIADRNPESAALVNLHSRAGDALTRVRAALAAGQTAEAEFGASEISTIHRDVQAMIPDLMKRQPSSEPWTLSSWIGIVAMVGVVLGLGIAVFVYMDRSGVTALSRIDGMRPVLVLAATISTIVFGGALLLGSLFSAEGTLDERFRRAREIFLVFSGVFGTVIGFYFGAGESKGQLGVAATLDALDGKAPVLSAYASGGTPPYSFSVSYGAKPDKMTLSSTDGFATFTFAGTTVADVLPLSVSATDSRGERGEKLVQASATRQQDQTSSGGTTQTQSATNGAKTQ